MTRTIQLTDGTRLRTSSHRRYVTFAVGDDSASHIVKRTDDRGTARLNHRRARRNYLRVVTVDFAGDMQGNASVLIDSADIEGK